MHALAFQDIMPIVRYIRENKLSDQPIFKRVLLYCQGDNPSYLRRMFNAKTSSNPRKFMYGVEVPKSVKHAMKLDMMNNNTLWYDATQLELKNKSLIKKP